MRTITTTILLALTLLCSTATATELSPATETLHSLVETRHQNEVQTRAANSLLKAGYLASASAAYRSLKRDMADELASLHALGRDTRDQETRTRIDRLIARVQTNLESVMESAQLLRVGPRLSRWPNTLLR